MDPFIPELALRKSLLAARFSDDELRRMCSTRLLTAIRPGAYVRSDDEASALALSFASRERISVVRSAASCLRIRSI